MTYIGPPIIDTSNAFQHLHVDASQRQPSIRPTYHRHMKYFPTALQALYGNLNRN